MTQLDQNVQVRNPRTGMNDRALDAPSHEELVKLTSRLRVNQKRWQNAGPAHRAEVLLRWRDAVIAHKDELAQALTEDTGRRTESNIEVQVSVDGLNRWASQAVELLDEETIQHTTMPGVSVAPSIRPYPLVGIISPWNFPLLLALIDAIPALAAGCAVIIKPSEITPRFLGPLAKTLIDVPEIGEVVGLIEGAGETGAALIPLV
ncbi:MAG: aldehyde dehydrogenase family protein, partial [Actinobacteria bacterium]|nr:aldehyde dehydrogenase family protein [Actinomycetota bacterium]